MQWSLTDVWADIEKNYKMGKAIGTGSYGTVMKATCLTTGRKVAIKHMNGFSKYEYDCVKVIREIQIMKGLKNASKHMQACFFPSILDLIIPESQLYCKQVKDIFLVMELEKTDLNTLMHNGNAL